MRRAALASVGAVTLLAGFIFFQHYGNSATPGAPDACKIVTFEGKRFTECIAVPGKHRIDMKITGSDGTIYRGFARLAADIDTSRVVFAVNGGMYDVRSRPIGYYAESAKRLYPLNTRDAGGNFYLKPNGVFFGDADGKWQVMTSEDFATIVNRRPSFGTQSGPMLLIGGELHPKIAADGTSLKLRNGVGVDAAGRAHFVISNEPVAFGTLARFLRDQAGARDALFLDGTVSALWDPAHGRLDARYPLSPLILVSMRSAD